VHLFFSYLHKDHVIMPLPNPYELYDTRSRGFATTDLTAIIQPQPIYGIDHPLKLGTLAMISVSSHRDKFPVTACSRIGPKGFCSGHRVTAGTLMFNTIDREAFTKITNTARERWKTPDTLMADEFPGFDIVITFVNERGYASYSTIDGVTILDEGITYSMENIALMESYSYMAVSRTPLQPVFYYEPKTSPLEPSKEAISFRNYIETTGITIEGR